MTVLSSNKLSLPETGIEAYAFKALTSDGKFRQFTVDGSGNPVDGSALLAAESVAKKQHYGNLTPRLFQELQGHGPADLIQVHIWAKVNVTYPRKEDLLNDSALRQTFQSQLSQNLSGAVWPIITWLNSKPSVTLAQLSSSDVRSPLVSARIPASVVKEASGLSNVAWVDLDTPATPTSDAWFQTTNVDVARSMTTGDGVIGCVVNGDVPTDTTYLRVAGINGGTAGFHMQQVAGIMSNTYTENTTSITDDPLYLSYIGDRSAGASAGMASTFAYCTDQGTSVINQRMAVDGSTSLTGSDIWKDFLVKLAPWPLIVSGAGNSDPNATANTWYCGNHGYNVIVVGGSDDNGTTKLGDDRMYSWSDWRNPKSSHGDYELPHLVAPGYCVDSADSECISGTSFSTPQVSGAAMLVMSRNKSLKGWPEATKSILLATALANIDADSFSHLGGGVGVGVQDMKDGVGLLDTGKAVALADQANAVSCNNATSTKGYWYGTMDLVNGFADNLQTHQLEYNCVWNLAATSDGAMRVVASWDATATCNAAGTSCDSDVLDADLDLYVYDSRGQRVCSSNSYDSSWEGCQFRVSAGSTYTVKIALSGASQPNTYFGLAWTDISKPPRPTKQASLTNLNHSNQTINIG